MNATQNRPKPRFGRNRCSQCGLLLAAAGVGVFLWIIFSLFGGGPAASGLLVIGLQALAAFVLTAAGFALMVSGADPFSECESDFPTHDDRSEPHTFV